jgi:hypothetical protein
MTFEELGAQIGRLVDEKNRSYGNAFAHSGKVLELMFPNGIPNEKVGDALFITRVLDKLFRIATAPDAFNEDPYADIAGYALLKAREVAERMLARNASSSSSRGIQALTYHSYSDETGEWTEHETRTVP